MRRRAAGAMPRAAIHGSSVGAAPSTMAPANARCSSASDGGEVDMGVLIGMVFIGVLLIEAVLVETGGGEPRLVFEHGEVGQVLVPFDQGGPRADARQRVVVQRPHGGIDAAVVRVDQQRAAQP